MKRLLAVVTLVVVFGSAFTRASDEGSASASDLQQGRGPLGLSETTIDGVTVYYEKALEPNLPIFQRELAKFTAQRAKVVELAAKRQEIIADINRILGVTDPNVDRQSKAFADIATVFSRTRLTFHLARTTTIKDFLRGGGQLPDFSYDRTSNTASYDPRVNVPNVTRTPEAYDLWIPVATDQEFGRYVGGIFEAFKQFFGPGIVSVTIHEVTEFTLLDRVRPTDPYWRWFSDGFANAISLDLIGKHMGEGAAKEFARGFDPNEKAIPPAEVNLRYWMLANYYPCGTQTFVEAESRINHARYAYATVEARRLIADHGIGCIREILDRITSADQRTGNELLRIIKDVTGEDMERRLMRCQTFGPAETGLAKYSQALDAASKERDYEQMLFNLMRATELRQDIPSNNHLQSFLNAALILHAMGNEQAADKTMQNGIDFYSQASIVNGRNAAREAFVFYALQTDHPQKARTMADEILQIAPDHEPSLVVKMLISRDEGNVAEARRYAEHIRRIADKQSKAYRLASELLPHDPNQPGGIRGEPSERREN